MANRPPDLGAKILGTIIVLALGAVVSKPFRLHPVVGALASFVLTAAVKHEVVLVASDLGF